MINNGLNRILVHKYGGSSVSDAKRIANVAKRIASAYEAGFQMVAVCSAMGDTTDDLLDLASQVTTNPQPRELDLLLSTCLLYTSPSPRD